MDDFTDSLIDYIAAEAGIEEPDKKAQSGKGRLNEAYEIKDPAAKDDPGKAKSFYREVKYGGNLGLDFLHQAFDRTFESEGLLDLFDDAGKLKSKGTYGRIKEGAAGASGGALQAYKALKALWVAQYIDGISALNPASGAKTAEKPAAKKFDEKARKAELSDLLRQAMALVDAGKYEKLKSMVPDASFVEFRIWEPYRVGDAFRINVGLSGADAWPGKEKKDEWRSLWEKLPENSQEAGDAAAALNAVCDRAISVLQDWKDKEAARDAVIKARPELAFPAYSHYYLIDGECYAFSFGKNLDLKNANGVSVSDESDRLTGLPDDAEFVGLVVMFDYQQPWGGETSWRYSYSSAKMPQEAKDILELKPFNEGNFASGSSFEFVSKDDAERHNDNNGPYRGKDYYFGDGIDTWGVKKSYWDRAN